MAVFVLTPVSRPAGDRPALPALKQQFSISELIVCRGDNQNHMVGLEETGLQDHTDENCLYCVGAIVLGYPTQPQINSTHPRTGQQSRDAFSESYLKLSVRRLSKNDLCPARFRRLPIMGRAERPSSRSDAPVQVLGGVGLQRRCCIARFHVRHAHTWRHRHR